METQDGSKSKNRKLYIRLTIGIGALLIILGSFYVYLGWPKWTGESVVLATRPVDPFDPLRGQYITINYEIGRIPAIESAQAGNRVYVTISEDQEGIWRYQSASLDKPKEGTFIRGQITRTSGGQHTVDYGIGQFFVERNSNVPTRGVTVEVKVASSGRAIVIQVLEDGEPVEIEYREFDFFRS